MLKIPQYKNYDDFLEKIQSIGVRCYFKTL